MSRSFRVAWKPQDIAQDIAQDEARIERDILQYLALKGIFAWATHSGKRKPVALGVPDIIGAARDGRMIAIEVKGEDGVVSERQEQFHLGLFRCRVRVIVARSLDDVRAAGV